MRDTVKGGALTEVTFFILLSLYTTAKHGYAIMQFIEMKTEGRLVLGAGTLYGAINNLQDKGWIKSFGDDSNRKKEYVITEQGKDVVQKELKRLNDIVAVATDITGGVKDEYKTL